MPEERERSFRIAFYNSKGDCLTETVKVAGGCLKALWQFHQQKPDVPEVKVYYIEALGGPL